MRRALALALVTLVGATAWAEIPNAAVVLEVLVPALPGDVPAAAPPRESEPTVLEDFILQAEIYLQYGMRSKALERLERVSYMG